MSLAVSCRFLRQMKTFRAEVILKLRRNRAEEPVKFGNWERKKELLHLHLYPPCLFHLGSPSLYTTSIRCLVCIVKRVKLDARGFKGQRLNGVIESWLQGAALRCFFQGSTIYHFSRPLSFSVSLAFSRLVRPVSKSREKKSIMQFKL